MHTTFLKNFIYTPQYPKINLILLKYKLCHLVEETYFIMAKPFLPLF